MTAARTPMAAGGEGGPPLRRYGVYCVREDGTPRNAEGLRGQSRGGGFEWPPKYKSNVFILFLKKKKISSATVAVKTLKCGRSRGQARLHVPASRSASFNVSRNICLLLTLDRWQHTLANQSLQVLLGRDLLQPEGLMKEGGGGGWGVVGDRDWKAEPRWKSSLPGWCGFTHPWIHAAACWKQHPKNPVKTKERSQLEPPILRESWGHRWDDELSYPLTCIINS